MRQEWDSKTRVSRLTHATGKVCVCKDYLLDRSRRHVDESYLTHRIEGLATYLALLLLKFEPLLAQALRSPWRPLHHLRTSSKGREGLCTVLVFFGRVDLVIRISHSFCVSHVFRYSFITRHFLKRFLILHACCSWARFLILVCLR